MVSNNAAAKCKKLLYKLLKYIRIDVTIDYILSMKVAYKGGYRYGICY